MVVVVPVALIVAVVLALIEIDSLVVSKSMMIDSFVSWCLESLKTSPFKRKTKDPTEKPALL